MTTTRPLRRTGVVAHHRAVDSDTVVGVRVTTPVQTYLDCAAEVEASWLIAIGDALLRRRLATADDLHHAATNAVRRRGAQAARRIARLVTAAAESPMESQLRLLIVTAGLPAPEVNVPVYDDQGGWLARPDLSYPRWRVALEYQGDQHRSDRRQWQADIRRARSLQNHHWSVLFATAADLSRPGSFLDAVRSAIDRRRNRDTPRANDEM